MKALITGANGFIGQVLLKKLINNGFKVRILTRNLQKNKIDNCEFFKVDLTSNTENLSQVAIGCDFVFNCAGEVIDKKKMYDLHVIGTERLIKGVLESYRIDKKQKHWIQLSSIGVYGNSQNHTKGVTINEDFKIKPVGEYEKTKAMSDEIIISYSKTNNLNYTILRPSTVVGGLMPNDSFKSLLNTIKNHQFFFIGSKSSISTYIHVDDVVDALLLISKHQSAKNETFNLSNDCYLVDIVNSISNTFGLKGNFLCFPEKIVRIIAFIFSNFSRFPLTQSRIDSLTSEVKYSSKKIKSMLDFKPSKSIPEFSSKYIKRSDV
jgi:nucleoside-diphosphate-sugar epimerase